MEPVYTLDIKGKQPPDTYVVVMVKDGKEVTVTIPTSLTAEVFVSYITDMREALDEQTSSNSPQ